MTDNITLTGVVATDPRHTITSAALPITNFRLASTQRRFDRAQNKWVDGETNWYTISAFRQLAVNSATSVNKGDRVVVTGRLRLREWQAAEKSGTNADIEADAIGHDLSWGTARWARTTQPSSGGAESQATPYDPASGSAGADARSAADEGWSATAESASSESAASESRTSEPDPALDSVDTPF